MSRPLVPQDRWDLATELVPWLRDFAGRFLMDSFTWDAPNVGANTVVRTTVTTSTVPQLKGLRPTMAIKLTPPTGFDDGLSLEAWIETDDQLIIRLTNATGSGIDMAEGTWKFVAVQP